jgi:choline dehydrogenase-like flavoprotein
LAEQKYDVIVVGSGPGGGIATYALAQAGLKVALVEAGPRFQAGVDYNGHEWPYDYRDRRAPNFWRDNFERGHFTPVGDRPGHGQIRGLGGRSICWAGHSLRFGPLDFESWPISYDEVAPYYSRAERLMGVYGFRDGLSNMPDGEFLKPVSMRCGEEQLLLGVQRLKAKGAKMEFVGQRKAMLTESPSNPNWKHRQKCHYCGHCSGCAVDAKYTSANTPIPLAEETGNLTVFTEAMVTRVRMAAEGGRAAGIDYKSPDGELHELDASAVVLACSAVETARLMLISEVGNSSGQVGRNLTSHFGVTVRGFFPQILGRDASNDDGTGYNHSLLTGLYWDEPSPKFEGTYQVQCGAGVTAHRTTIRTAPGYGSSFKKTLREWNIANAGMNMQGTTLTSAKKFVDLDPDRRDNFDMPLPRVHLHYEDSDLAMAQDMVEKSEEIIRAGGGEVIETPGTVGVEDLVIDLNHWVGTARMGTDPKTSVVDLQGRSHDVPNLFVADASVFAANPEKNPTLTNIALSWRTADGIVERFRRNDFA